MYEHRVVTPSSEPRYDTTTMEVPAAERAANAVSTLLRAPIALTKYTANEPLLTGPLLYILTRGPPHIRERLLSTIRSRTTHLTNDRLQLTVKVLKVLFTLGVVGRLNNALNALALNGWYLPYLKPMSKWKWDGLTETVIITGGCSGFGYEMVKGFSGKAKVVVLDVTDLPKEFEDLPEVYYYRCDLTDFGAISSTTAAIKNRHGNPTVLINNAGIGKSCLLLCLFPASIPYIFHAR